jgi:hypothetical protein
MLEDACKRKKRHFYFGMMKVYDGVVTLTLTFILKRNDHYTYGILQSIVWCTDIFNLLVSNNF